MLLTFDNRVKPSSACDIAVDWEFAKAIVLFEQVLAAHHDKCDGNVATHFLDRYQLTPSEQSTWIDVHCEYV